MATDYVQLYNEDGTPLCSRKTKKCSECEHRYVAKGKKGSEYHLLYCPECGFPRGCRQKVKAEGDVCHHHSKDARKGAGHPNFKDGRHSKHLPTELLPSYEATMQDEQRLDLSAELAVLDALIDDRLQALNTGDAADAWEDAGKAVKRLEEGVRTENGQAIGAAIRELKQLTADGRDKAATRAELADLIMKRTRVADSDRSRLADLGEYMTRGAVLTLLRYVIQIVTENVKDLEGGKDALSTISAGFSQLFGRLRSSPTARPTLEDPDA